MSGSPDWREERPLSEEAAFEFDKFIDLANDIFGAHGEEDVDFEVEPEAGAPCEASLLIKNYGALAADRVRHLACELRDELGTLDHYWRLLVFVYRPDKPHGQDDMVLWLGIDRYRIDQYCGQVKTSRFADVDELERHYWRHSTN